MRLLLRQLPGLKSLLPVALLLGSVAAVPAAIAEVAATKAAAVEATPAPHSAEAMLSEEGSLQIWQPSPKFSPRQVVQRQLASMQASIQQPDAIRQCFMFASPANRAVTGPIERFEGILRMPAYRSLVSPATALVGKAVVKGDQATVLVTLLSTDAQVTAFRFYLSKQTAAPYRDCWMTDAVTHQQSIPKPVSEDSVAEDSAPSKSASDSTFDARRNRVATG